MDPKIYKAVAMGDAKYLKNLSPNEWSELGQMKSHHGNTILHIAIQYRKWSIAKMIIRKCNSLLHEQNFNGDTPLHLSVRYPERWEIRMVRLLIQDNKERKRLVRIENIKGDTALHEAVRSNNVKAVELLIGVDSELACVNNNEGESPIFIAVDKSFYKIARRILKTSPKCSFAGRKGMNVLHAVVMRSKHSLFYTIIWLLLWFSAPITILGSLLFRTAPITILGTLLAIAALLFWCLRVITKYFKFTTIGSDFIREVYKKDSSTISQADQFGWIPLHYAAYIGNIQVVELLLKLDNSDTLIRMKENEGMSALHIAAKGNQTLVVKRLSKKHPYTNEYVDNKGRTAFHVAAEDGKVNVVRYFNTSSVLAHVLNEGDIDGNTPLHLAALQRRKKICILLISHSRIDLGARNKVGLTAIDIIKSKEILSMRRLSKYAQSLEHFVAREYIKQDEQSRNEEVLTSSMNNEIVKVEKHARKRKHLQESYKELANVNLIIVTLVATVTFTAAITVPGGYNSDSKDKHSGTAILTKKTAFQAFVIANSVAFGLSTALLTLQLWNAIVKNDDENAKKVLKWSLRFRNWAVLAMVVAFLSAEYVVLARSRALAGAAVTVACFAFFAPAFAISWDDNLIFTPISFLVKTIFRPME